MYAGIRNRINVALSRAQHGLYILGNSDFLQAASATSRNPEGRESLWLPLLDELEQRGCIDEAIPLRCQAHPEAELHARKAEDFALVAPEGGCTRQCGVRLACGHPCPLVCHPFDPGHDMVFCPRPCERLHEPCGHLCHKLCGDACGPCPVPVLDLRLPCGHIKKASHPPVQLGGARGVLAERASAKRRRSPAIGPRSPTRSLATLKWPLPWQPVATGSSSTAA